MVQKLSRHDNLWRRRINKNFPGARTSSCRRGSPLNKLVEARPTILLPKIPASFEVSEVIARRLRGTCNWIIAHDRSKPNHRKLWRGARVAATHNERILIGITSDTLLKKKAYAVHIEEFEIRK